KEARWPHPDTRQAPRPTVSQLRQRSGASRPDLQSMSRLDLSRRKTLSTSAVAGDDLLQKRGRQSASITSHPTCRCRSPVAQRRTPAHVGSVSLGRARSRANCLPAGIETDVQRQWSGFEMAKSPAMLARNMIATAALLAGKSLGPLLPSKQATRRRLSAISADCFAIRLRRGLVLWPAPRA